MAAHVNVKISLELMNQTIELLESLDICDSDPILVMMYRRVLDSFLLKRLSNEKRDAYSKIVFAKDDDEQFNARMQYLLKKREYNESNTI